MQYIEVNQIVNQFSLTGDKFLYGIHLNNLDLVIVFVDQLLKIEKEFKQLKKTGDTKHIYRNELGKACFQHGMAYGDLRDLAGGKASD